MGFLFYIIALVFIGLGVKSHYKGDLGDFQAKLEFGAVAVFIAGWFFSMNIAAASIAVAVIIIIFFKTEYWKKFYNPLNEEDVLESEE